MTNKRPTIQVINRATSLLEAITRNPPPVTLKILSAESGLHPATAYRILSSLSENGFTERDERGRYRLGVKFLQLSSRTRMDMDIQREALPVMEWLRDRTGETVNLAVREGNDLVYVERVASRHTIRAEQVIGKRAPLHVTAVGKVFMGELGGTFCREYANSTGLTPLTAKSRTDIGILEREIVNTVENGYALDDEEAEEGVGCIGVAVRDSSGTAVAGLSVSAPIERRQVKSWLPIVQQAGRQLSERLGYNADGRTNSESGSQFGGSHDSGVGGSDATINAPVRTPGVV